MTTRSDGLIGGVSSLDVEIVALNRFLTNDGGHEGDAACLWR